MKNFDLNEEMDYHKFFYCINLSIYYQRNKEKLLNRAKEHYKSNKETLQEQARKYRELSTEEEEINIKICLKKINKD